LPFAISSSAAMLWGGQALHHVPVNISKTTNSRGTCCATAILIIIDRKRIYKYFIFILFSFLKNKSIYDIRKKRETYSNLPILFNDIN